MDQTSLPGPTLRARPYGWIGLIISSLLILVGAFLLFALALGIVFLGAGLVLGWHEALVRVTNLRDAMLGDTKSAEQVLLFLGIVLYLGISLAVLIAARVRGGEQWRDLVGWHPWDIKATPRNAWIAVAVAFVFSTIAAVALSYLYPPSQEWNPMPSSRPALVIFFVLAVLAAPLTEELLFRGWLYTALRARLNLGWALFVASAVFALAHWESTHLYALAVFPVGLALGYLREKTDSLFASMSFHAVYNGVAFILMFFGT